NATYETPKGTTISSVGSYYWFASYSGDHNNSATHSGCADDRRELARTPPTSETTQQPATGTVSAIFKDKATISGLFGSPEGTIPFNLYANPQPQSTPLFPYTRSSDLNATYETPKGTTISSVGSYYWFASYSGDHNNSATHSGCA